MRFLVVGPGAMGCLFAANLKKSGYEVSLLDYKPERAAQINAQGITVQDTSGTEYRVDVPVMTCKIPEALDFALICVKSYSTERAAQALKPLLPKETVVVTLQNGIGNVEILQEIFGARRVIGGVTAEGATLISPGRIRHAGRGETAVGPGMEGGPAQRLASALARAGFQTRTVENVDELLWGKLIINVGINALTAITRLKNGRLIEYQGTVQIMESAVKEAMTVAEAKNIRLPYPDPIARVKEVCKATADNIASMLQDVLRQRMTEIDAINGAIVRHGEELGIPTPVNATLTYLLQTIQETYREQA
ncbi:MAG: 2-dehydropantoate 2-reductase [Deltaproteobacteria bacterium]|nr:2-dehydropantoate 2-reductase [Deltaproteobacteria bacterium]